MPDKLNHRQLDQFLGYALDRYKAGEASRTSAIGTIAHLVTALTLPKDAGPSDPGDYMKAVLAGDMED